jgi:hypothetical protein
MFKYAENRMCYITTSYNVMVDADACCVDGMVDAALFAQEYIHASTVKDIKARVRIPAVRGAYSCV